MNRIEGPHQGQNPNRLEPQPALAGDSSISPNTQQKKSFFEKFNVLTAFRDGAKRQHLPEAAGGRKDEEKAPVDRTPQRGRNRMWSTIADHKGRSIATGTGLVGLVAGGAIAVNVARDGGPDIPPTEPNGGHTQTVTPEPNTPPAGVTVTETPTATPVETVSPSPEPTEVEEVDKVGPYEVAYRETIGDMNFMVAKGMEEDKYDASGQLIHRSLLAIVPNEDVTTAVPEITDVRAEIEKKTMEGKYYVWKKRISENPNATFEEFLQEYNGEGDMTFEYTGVRDNDTLPSKDNPKIEIDLRKLDMMFVPIKSGTVRVADNGIRYGPRNTGGRTVIEIWSPTSGKAYLDGANPERSEYAIALDLGLVYYILGSEAIERNGVFTNTEFQDPELFEIGYVYAPLHDRININFLGLMEPK